MALVAEDTKEFDTSQYLRPSRTPSWVREGRKPVPPTRETLVKGIAELQGVSPWKVERILIERKKKERLAQAASFAQATEASKPAPAPETPAPAAPPTLEQISKQLYGDVPEAPERESWVKRLLGRILGRKTEPTSQAASQQPEQIPSPKPEVSEEQQKWIRYRGERKGNLGQAAEKYQVKETKESGPVPQGIRS